MAMQTGRGIPSACEMDLLSAVTMMAMQQAGGDTSPMVQDWFAPFGDDQDACICIHCSNFAKEVFEEKPVIGVQGGQARIWGEACCYGSLKGRIKPGPMTYCKITTDDKDGVMKAYLGEGEILDADVKTYSPYAVCKIKNLNGLMNYIGRNGFEHHFVLMHGCVADILQEALQKLSGL